MRLSVRFKIIHADAWFLISVVGYGASKTAGCMKVLYKAVRFFQHSDDDHFSIGIDQDRPSSRSSDEDGQAIYVYGDSLPRLKKDEPEEYDQYVCEVEGKRDPKKHIVSYPLEDMAEQIKGDFVKHLRARYRKRRQSERCRIEYTDSIAKLTRNLHPTEPRDEGPAGWAPELRFRQKDGEKTKIQNREIAYKPEAPRPGPTDSISPVLHHLLDSRERLIVKLRAEGSLQKDIAERVKLSPSQVSRILKKLGSNEDLHSALS